MSKCSTENKKVYVGFDVSEKTAKLITIMMQSRNFFPHSKTPVVYALSWKLGLTRCG